MKDPGTHLAAEGTALKLVDLDQLGWAFEGACLALL